MEPELTTQQRWIEIGKNVEPESTTRQWAYDRQSEIFLTYEQVAMN